MTNSRQHLPSGQSEGPFLPRIGGSQDATPVTKVSMLVEYAVRYECTHLVETGLYAGGGSGMGVVDAGVVRETDYCIVDWQASNCELARAKYPRALVLQGDSALWVSRLLDGFDAAGIRALFWLDAHGIEIDVGFPPCPLNAELEALAAAEVAHVVLVDDLHMMGGHDWPDLASLRDWCDRSRWLRSESHDIMQLVPHELA